MHKTWDVFFRDIKEPIHEMRCGSSASVFAVGVMHSYVYRSVGIGPRCVKFVMMDTGKKRSVGQRPQLAISTVDISASQLRPYMISVQTSLN